jgi:hypothetical protein
MVLVVALVCLGTGFLIGCFFAMAIRLEREKRIYTRGYAHGVEESKKKTWADASLYKRRQMLYGLQAQYLRGAK